MPLPERYEQEVPDIALIWSPEGYFKAQGDIWKTQCSARNKLEGAPTDEQLKLIKKALVLKPKDISHLNKAEGHETNKYLRLVQSRLPDEVGNFIHLGNTSSDVLDTSLAVQIFRSLQIIKQDLWNLADSFETLALDHRHTLQIARTHGQHAIPQTFGRQVIGWSTEVKRGVKRCDQAMEVIGVGKLSGEVGTNVFISPEIEEEALKQLALDPDPAPTQVISRDRHSQVVALMAINGLTLARITTNIRTLARTEIGEVREPFEDSKQGSSAMPHKRNPDMSERVVGISRRLLGATVEEFSSMMLWDERDISHSSTERFVFPDVFGGLTYATRLTQKIVNGLEVFPDKMAANIEMTYGGIYSSRLLDALIKGGLPRTAAYDLVKPLAQQAIDTRVNLFLLAQDNPQITSLVNPETLEELFKPDFYLRNTDVAFRRLGLID